MFGFKADPTLVIIWSACFKWRKFKSSLSRCMI